MRVNAMREAVRFLVAVGWGALVLTAACFALSVLSFKTLLPPAARIAPAPPVASVAYIVILALALLVPAVLGAFWIFRRLRSCWQRRDALVVAIVFGILSPFSLLVAMPAAEIPAGYTGNWWKPLGLVGAFISVALVVWLGTSIGCALILWLFRRLRRVEAM
jgi:hypothetical protein